MIDNGNTRPFTTGCPACEERRFHFVDEWETFHPRMWAALTEAQRVDLRAYGRNR
jgi:hypothetical protein